MNKKHPKNPFKVFNKMDEKKDPVNKSMPFKMEVKEKKGFKHIPPEAFMDIYDYPEYIYLCKGLYVGNNHIRINDPIAAKYLEENPREDTPMDLLMKMMGHKSDPDEYLKRLNWYESKELAQRMCGKILSPAEYFCMLDWATDEKVKNSQNSGLKPFRSEMSLNGGYEWLDMLISDQKTIIANPEIKNLKVIGGQKKTVETLTNPNKNSNHNLDYAFFDRKHIIKRYGFPMKLNSGGSYEFEKPAGSFNAAMTYTYMDMNYLNFQLHPSQDGKDIPKMNFRVAKKVTLDDIISWEGSESYLKREREEEMKGCKR